MSHNRYATAQCVTEPREPMTGPIAVIVLSLGVVYSVRGLCPCRGNARSPNGKSPNAKTK